jgi:hypothetical protein
MKSGTCARGMTIDSNAGSDDKPMSVIINNNGPGRQNVLVNNFEIRQICTEGTVLFMAAVPPGTPPINVGGEYFAISQKIEGCGHLKIVTCAESLTFDTFEIEAMREARIIHVSGHGRKDGSLILHDHDRRARHWSAYKIAQVIGAAGRLCPDLEMVVLNYCYSARAAKLLSRDGLACVGARDELKDEDACAFSRLLYGVLAKSPTRTCHSAVNYCLRLPTPAAKGSKPIPTPAANGNKPISGPRCWDSVYHYLPPKVRSAGRAR